MATNQRPHGGGAHGGRIHGARGNARPSLAPIAGARPRHTARESTPLQRDDPVVAPAPISSPESATPPVPKSAPLPLPLSTAAPAQTPVRETAPPAQPADTITPTLTAKAPAQLIDKTEAILFNNPAPVAPNATQISDGTQAFDAPVAPPPGDTETASPGNIPSPAPDVPDVPEVPDVPDVPDAPNAPGVRVPRRGIRILIAVFIPVFAAVLVLSLWQIFSIQFEYSEADNEYEDLRRQAFITPPSQSAASDTAAQGDIPEDAPAALNLDSVMSQNPECTGWIDIPNTSLSYPFVRASNNDKYLNRTFLGKQNAAGAIFMDYRNPADLSAPHLILYGHNMKNGSMFGLLPKYLNADYLQANSTLVLHNLENTYTYQIFSARVTDAYDPSYRVDFSGTEDLAAFAATYGAPAGTSQMLTLSTCTNVQDEERILIHAALVAVS